MRMNDHCTIGRIMAARIANESSLSRDMGLRRSALLIVTLLTTMTLISGCTRSQYAKWADRDAYGTICEGQAAALGQAYRFDIAYYPVDCNSYLKTAEDETEVRTGR